MIINYNLSISPTYLCLYPDYERKIDFLGISRTHKINFLKNTTDGIISKHAKKSIFKSISWLLYFTNKKNIFSKTSKKVFNYKLGFLTLTLPALQFHSDNYIKNKMLKQFLYETCKHDQLKFYIWRAEKQKNGSIHFHIIIDRYISHHTLRNRWNRICKKEGYINLYKENYLKKYRAYCSLSDYEKNNCEHGFNIDLFKKAQETDFNNPNSIDIHSIKNIKNLAGYFAKYMTKNENIGVSNNLKNDLCESFNSNTVGIFHDKINNIVNNNNVVNGRLWYCSKNLQNIKNFSVELSNKIQSEIDILFKKKFDKLKKLDYCDLFFIRPYDLLKIGCYHIFELFKDYTNKLLINDT